MRNVWELLFVFVLVGACSDRTAVVIDIRAEGLRVPEDVNRIEVSVAGEGGTSAQGRYVLRSVPQSLAIRPSAGLRGNVVVTVRAFRDEAWVLQRVVEARFANGASAHVEVVLEGSCRQVVCSGDCENGRCVRDRDGGMQEMPDAHMPDAPTLDAEDQDAGEDAAELDAPTNDSPIDSALDVPTDAPLVRTGIVLNEVDYDQADIDTAEFIEIYNAATEPRVLDGLVVFAMNGADGLPYANWVLTGTLAPGAYVLIHGPMVTPPSGVVAIPMFQSAVLQNGIEGIVIFDTRTNLLVDALADGMTNTNSLRAMINGMSFEMVEGTHTPARDTSAPNRSLVRLPNGTDTSNASVDWLESLNITPGAANVP